MKLSSYLALLFMGTCSAGDLTLYVGTKSSIYTVDFSTENGAFAEAQETHAAPTSSFLAFSKDQKFLYSTFSLTDSETNKRTGAVASYTLSGNNSLKKTSESTSGGRGTCYVSLDMTGKCLLSADYGSGHLSSYLLSDNGQITKRVSTITLEGSSINPQRQKGPHAHSIYISPDNKHVYAADLGSDKVLCYALDSTTAGLTPLPSASTPPGSGPRHIAIHPDGQRLFVLNELTCTVSTFSRDAQTGGLALLSTVNVLQGETDGMTC
ncbi:lactonase family protein, partial [Rubritalea halochordaticola]|uniref:lactonase family protein n=1 Tax=Rubritalea halochordaticola TaxID=714537 RepID=UPI0031FDDD1C